MRPPDHDVWIGLTAEALPVGAVAAWAVLPSCGALVLFSGTVRDHAGERSGVTHLVYEAYEEQVEPRLGAIAGEARRRWPAVGRVALLHRIGRVELGEPAVVVAVSAPHRPDAFAAARWCIDTLKATVPIWKLEVWDGGQAWSEATCPVAEIHERDMTEVRS